MKKLYIPVVDLVRPLAAALVGLALVAGTLSFRVGILHQGVSAAEQPIVQTVQAKNLSGKAILQENSLYLPHKVALYGLQKADFTSVRAIRGVGVAFGLLGIIAMMLVLLRWHTRRIALLTGLLLVTSAGFLHAARWAAPETVYLLMPWLIYFGIRLQENNLRFLGLSTITILVALMLYIPGLCWFIIPAAIWQRRRLLYELKQAGKLQSTFLIICLMTVLTPLLLTLLTSPHLLADWAGLTGPSIGILEIFKNLIGVPVQFLLRSDGDPALHVGRLPYLDIATIVFIALGAYRYYTKRRLDRVVLVVGGLAIGSILTALNFQAYSLLLPFLYLLAAAGMTWLLQQWFAVFPRNPLARNIGVGLLVAVVALASFYHLRRYFIAWPQAPETKQAYSLPPLQE